MQRNLQLLSVLKRAFVDDPINILPIATHGLTTIRSYSGRIVVADIKPFCEMLESRRDQAQRSVLVQVQSEHSYGDLWEYCSGYGAVGSMYHYQTLKNIHYVLVEMVNKPSVEHLLRESSYLEASQAIPVKSPFLWFKMTGKKKFERKSSKSHHNNVHFRCALECEDFDNLLKSLIATNSISEQIELLKTKTEISEVGTRLRFLTARQLELSLSGLFRDITACPFGSSVNGFGRNGCDLDLVLVFPENNSKPDSRLVHHAKACSAEDRLQIQNHIEVIGDLMTCFMPGCVSVRKITQARVPIVKYRQELTHLDCDVSLYHSSCLQMSEVLYILEGIDHRVKQLVMAVRAWAKAVGLTNSTPGRWISNFSLTLLVLFFLQQTPVKILPPLNRITQKSYILSAAEFRKYASTLVSQTAPNAAATETLLLDFFQFYAQYDFGSNGINLLSGKNVVKPDYSAMFIVNPVEPELNVSKNVSGEETEKLRAEMRNAAWILETKGQRAVSDEPWGLAKLLEPVSHTPSFSSFHHRPRSRLVDVKNDSKVTIGDVSKEISPPKRRELAPLKYLSMGSLTQTTLRHLRWMLQKDKLGQDMFLLGPPGASRRRLALAFLELTGREVEYIALSRDTTESDMKQRREIVNGTAVYFNQSAVRAALEGRVLVLEGIEKAERNVLPVLNNLLENREMHLEDGRFLIPANRYDKLLKEFSKEQLESWNLMRVSEDFRVIALGLPVPKFQGNPLDPPLRSRFQARDVTHPSYQELVDELTSACPEADAALIKQLLSVAHALTSSESNALGLPDFPLDNVLSLAPILRQCSKLDPHDLLTRCYPYNSMLGREGKSAVKSVLDTFQVSPGGIKSAKVERVEADEHGNTRAFLQIQDTHSTVEVKGGNFAHTALETYVETESQETVLAQLLLSHTAGDLCLLGPRGCGKSTVAARLAQLLSLEIEPIVLYQDMSSRDLVQQRTTNASGDTVWKNSPLVDAALAGKLALMEGIDRVHSSTLAVLHRLVQDRELQLFDGRRLVRYDRFDEIMVKTGKGEKELLEAGVLRVHPSFRILALADTSNQGGQTVKWLNGELMSLFLFHEIAAMSRQDEHKVITSLCESVSEEKVQRLLSLANAVRSSSDPAVANLSSSFSTRQLLRIARRIARFPDDSLFESVQKACLGRFLPTLARESLQKVLEEQGITEDARKATQDIQSRVTEDYVEIGNTRVDRYKAVNTSKVPDILFYDVPQHLALLQWLVQDFTLGEHLLLVGNQGVGKNKIADRLLQLLNRPREYIQLHRDTTVQTLTLQPSVRDGVVTYEDSPLVQAVRDGLVLVVDEADKAPTHVTCILKTLVERGEMTLSDGRKILPHRDPRCDTQPNVIPMHPDFRVIVLANRPGFPFLGNDFFATLGDLFSCHAVDNPSPESEISLLKQYGPDVPEAVILKLVEAFGELRKMADDGLVQYPYSTREVVNIVKHLQMYPDEGLSAVVKNVFDFDQYQKSALEALIPVLQKHGIPINASLRDVFLAKEYPLPKLVKYGTWEVGWAKTIPVDVKNVKFGQWLELKSSVTDVDYIQARSASFTELQSYWTLPIPTNSVVQKFAVSRGATPPEDTIHVLTINPIRLYSMRPGARQVQVLQLEGRLPRLVHGVRHKFSLNALGEEFKDCLVLQEENTDFMAIIDPENAKIQEINRSSITEKLSTSIGMKSRTYPRIVESPEDNVLISFHPREGVINVLDISNATCYTLELPLKLFSVCAPSTNTFLLQDTNGDKFLLEKREPTDPMPSVLQPITEKINESTYKLGAINQCSYFELNGTDLSQIVGEKITAPNRVLTTSSTYAVTAVGFPELKHSTQDLYMWPRPTNPAHRQGQSVFLESSNQIIMPVAVSSVPKEITDKLSGLSGFLEVTDLGRRCVNYIPVPERTDMISYYIDNEVGVLVRPRSEDAIVVVDRLGTVRLFETGRMQLQRSLDEWMAMVGQEKKPLRLTVESKSGKDVSAPKHGKVDPKNEPHVGGNTWAGGSGGRDTAGLGGKGGPYRLDSGHDVHQLSDSEKDDIPDDVKRAAHEMGRKAFMQRLKEIQMSEYDHSVYTQYSAPVARQVAALKVIIDSVQAKAKERLWSRHQTSGDLDDLKLIEGITGEKTIYRRRAEKDPEPGSPQTKPKRLRLVVDVSGSMYRFNGYDGRLDRMMEATVLVMEAFENQETKFSYDIIGHSGETFDHVFVEAGKPPKNNKERLDIIKTMHAHAQFCLSGDHTLHATVHAIHTIAQEECDEAIVVVLSDANLQRYGIPPQRFGQALTSNLDVGAYAIFIGSLGDEAERLAAALPAGRAFVCMDLARIPQILQQIFTASVLKAT